MGTTREKFRQKLSSENILLTPLVHDALSAQVAEEVGFEVIGISGYGVSLSSLGRPDVGYLSFDEMMRPARNISVTTDIPVWADVDTGYGNAVSARRTVEECILNTNLAGLFIEDQVAPKRCGHTAGKRVISREEAVGKIAAVCDMRDELDEDFVVIARTDARGAVGGSLEEAIERGNAFSEAGADIIFIEAPTSHAEFQEIGQEVSGQLMCMGAGVPGDQPRLDLATAADYGFDLYGVVPTIKPAATRMYDVLAGLRKDGIAHLTEFEEEIEDHPIENLHRFSGFDEIRAIEETYLPEGEQDKYEQSKGYDIGE